MWHYSNVINLNDFLHSKHINCSRQIPSLSSEIIRTRQTYWGWVQHHPPTNLSLHLCFRPDITSSHNICSIIIIVVDYFRDFSIFLPNEITFAAVALLQTWNFSNHLSKWIIKHLLGLIMKTQFIVVRCRDIEQKVSQGLLEKKGNTIKIQNIKLTALAHRLEKDG